MESRKIAIICNYKLLPERVGGMDCFFWQFDEKCKENDIHVDWFFPNKSNHGGYDKLTIFESKNTSVETFFLDFCVQNNSQYEYIITHFVELCTPFFKKVKQFYKGKIIVVDHNSRPIKGYPLKKKISKRIKGFLFSKYIDQFIGVSNYTAAEIVKDFGFQVKSKTKTIYNGVHIQNIKVREKTMTGKPSFLVVAQLVESKGIQDLIEAVFLLPDTIKKDIVIDVYGDGPYRKELENKAVSLALEKSFNFRGSTPNLKSIYCEYDYLIHPSYIETFCYCVIEALASNIGVITTNEGGNVLGVITHLENGFLFNAKNTEQLAFLISQIWIGNLKIVKKTREDIEKHFSLEKMVNQHFALLMKN